MSYQAEIHDDQPERVKAAREAEAALTPITDEKEWTRVAMELFEKYKARWGEDYADRLMHGAATRAIITQMMSEEEED